MVAPFLDRSGTVRFFCCVWLQQNRPWRGGFRLGYFQHPSWDSILLVRAEGIGKTFDEALQNALVLAIEQVNGVRASKSVDASSLVGDYHSQESSSGQYAAAESDRAHAGLNVNARVSGTDGTNSVREFANADASENAQGSGSYSSALGYRVV